jgi:hypothetical protein
MKRHSDALLPLPSVWSWRRDLLHIQQGPSLVEPRLCWTVEAESDGRREPAAWVLRASAMDQTEPYVGVFGRSDRQQHNVRSALPLVTALAMPNRLDLIFSARSFVVAHLARSDPYRTTIELLLIFRSGKPSRFD